MYPNVCVCLNCREEFAPLEGNETREFCSWDCEEAYYADDDAEDNTDHYNYGRK